MSDLVVRGATVFPGDGPGRVANVAVVDGLIAAVGDLGEVNAEVVNGAGATLLASLLPALAQAGGAEATLARAAAPGQRERIARDVAAGLPGWENLLGTLGTLGPERIVVGGETLAELAGSRTAVNTVCDLLVESKLAAPMVLH